MFFPNLYNAKILCYAARAKETGMNYYANGGNHKSKILIFTPLPNLIHFIIIQIGEDGIMIRKFPHYPYVLGNAEAFIHKNIIDTQRG